MSFMPMTQLAAGYGSQYDLSERTWLSVKSGFTHFAENDVVFAKITPCFQNRKSAVMRGLKNGYGAGTTELHVIRCLSGVIPEYILLFVKNQSFISDAVATIQGVVGQQRIDANFVKKYFLPLPPLAEQQRIVEQIEMLLKYVDIIDSDAETLEKSITLAKQKILDLAIRGKLVPQDPTDEPASELLKKIKAEKDALVKAGKIKKDKHESHIFKGDDNCYHENIDGKVTDITEEIPFDLPDGWAWCRMISIGQTNIGLTYKPADITDNGTIVLRSNNIQNGKLDLADTVRVSCEISPSLQLNETDILICARNGSKALVGKCTLIPSKTETLSFGAFMAVFRSKQNPWVYNILNSGYFRDYLFCSNSTQICQLTQDMLKRFIIPLPPLAEQKRIVSQVEKLFSVLETMRG